MRTVTATFIDYDELQDLIEKNLGEEVDVLCELEANNGCAYKFTVGQSDVNRAYDKTNFMFGTLRNLVVRLVASDVIPMGDIVVEVSW